MNEVTLREAVAKATGEQTESAKRQKNCLEETLASEAAEDMLKAYAYAVIDGNLPYSICEDSWPLHFLNFGIKFGVHASQSKARNTSASWAEASEYPSVEGYTITRAKLTKAVDDICTKTLKESRETLLPILAAKGGTILSDGRANIAHAALIVFAAQTNGYFYGLGTYDTGTQKKDARFLADLHQHFWIVIWRSHLISTHAQVMVLRLA